MIFQLLYSSSAIKLLKETELSEILRKSQENNARLDITGLLLYHDGNFIQVLEGPEDAVRAVYARIEADNRHANLHLLTTRHVEHRLFPDWAMGFKRLTDVPEEDQEAFRHFFDDTFHDPAFLEKPDRVVIFLKAFLQAIR